MLNPVWLKSFVALVQHREFLAAARALGIAQPTLTQHIQKLEQQLNVLLIERGRQGCEPTRAARALLPFANSLLQLEQRARQAVQQTSLRVGASSNIGIYLLQPHVRSFLNQSAHCEVELVIDNNPAIASQLSNAELDMAVMEWWQEKPGFQARPWRQEPMVLIVSPDHPLAQLPSVSKQQLAAMTLLGGEPGTGTGRLLSEFFGEGSMMPKVSRQLGSTEAVKQAVKAGLGVSLVLAAAVRDEVRHGSLRAIPVAGSPLHKELSIIYRHALAAHPPVAAFAGHLCVE